MIIEVGHPYNPSGLSKTISMHTKRYIAPLSNHRIAMSIKLSTQCVSDFRPDGTGNRE